MFDCCILFFLFSVKEIRVLVNIVNLIGSLNLGSKRGKRERMKHGGLERDEKVGIKRSKENLGETKPDSVNMNSFIRQQSFLITRNVATNITPTESSKQCTTKCSNWWHNGWMPFFSFKVRHS